ncbi:hypothetical protein D3C71_2251790 [compost metagenome]
MEKVVIDPSFRYNLARAAWEKAKKTYSLNRVLRQLKSVYERYQVTEQPGKEEAGQQE